MIAYVDRERRRVAKTALLRLASGASYSRREIFFDEKAGQYTEQTWQRRFVDYLTENGILFRLGGQRGPNVRYNIPSEQITPNQKALLNKLLDHEEALDRLLFSNADPMLAAEGPSAAIMESNDPTEEEDESPEEAPAESITPEINILEMIAERLVGIINLLDYMRQTIDATASRNERIEKKLDLILGELGVKLPENKA